MEIECPAALLERALGDEGFGAFPVGIDRQQLKAGVQNMARHGLAHDAQAYKSNFHPITPRQSFLGGAAFCALGYKIANEP